MLIGKTQGVSLKKLLFAKLLDKKKLVMFGYTENIVISIFCYGYFDSIDIYYLGTYVKCFKHIVTC